MSLTAFQVWVARAAHFFDVAVEVPSHDAIHFPHGQPRDVLRSSAVACRYRSASGACNRVRFLHLAKQPVSIDTKSLADTSADHGRGGDRDRPDADRADRRN